MAETSWPYDNQLSYEDSWREMASKWLGDGVLYGELSNLAISADSTGMNVKEAAGKAWVKGTFYSNSAIKTLTITAAPSTGNTRRDRVVLRNDMVANATTAIVLPGTPIAIPGTPVAPALTQSTTVWDLSLGTVLVPAGTVTIGPSAVADDRSYAVPRNSTFAPVRDNTNSAPLVGTLPDKSQYPARLRMTGGQAIVTSSAGGHILLYTDPAAVAIVSAWCTSGDFNVDVGFFTADTVWSTVDRVAFKCFRYSDHSVAINQSVRVNWGCIYAV